VFEVARVLHDCKGHCHPRWDFHPAHRLAVS
jgi:hypothetical protein